MRARIADQSLDIPARDQQTPEALGALQKAEIEKWWPIVLQSRDQRISFPQVASIADVYAGQ